MDGMSINGCSYQVLGRIEISALLEVDDRTAHAWYSRGLLPPPDHEAVNGSPAWDRLTVLRWACATGRLPDSLVVEAAAAGLDTTPKARRGGRVAKKEYGSKAAS
jgi:hypothetical protein